VSVVEAHGLPDIQGQADLRDVALAEVGVEGLAYPICVVRARGDIDRVSAEAALVTSLDGDQRGTHMSRFVETLDRHAKRVEPSTPYRLAHDLREVLGADRARVKLSFDLYVDRVAPVSGLSAPLRIRCWLGARSSATGGTQGMGVRVPVTSLCPCSKEIADYGAHSQRGYIEVEVEPCASEEVFVEELVDIATEAGSAPIYPLLKRGDERYVTMQAYDNPAFVEDLVRAIYVALRADQRFAAFTISASNDESIHDHRAVARVGWERSV
jgi:GTP cyclohydrolase IB